MAQNGIKTTDLTAAPLLDSVVGNREGTAVIIPIEDLKTQILVGVPKELHVPAVNIASNPTETTAAIQAVLEVKDHVVIPEGEWVINRSIILDSNKTLKQAPGAKVLRADGMFDPVFMNRQAVTYAVGNPDPGTSHPHSPINVFFPDAGGAAQEWWVDGALRARTFDIFFDTHVYGTGPTGVVVGDIITTADGYKWEVVDAAATNTPVVNQEGVKFIPALNYNISVIGAAGSLLHGNGVNNRDGDFIGWQRFRRRIGVLCGVSGYNLTDLNFEKSAEWNMMVQFSERGIVKDLHFDQPQFKAEGVPNGDGLDLSFGVHRTYVNGLHGTTSDDLFMVNGGIYPKHDPAYGADDPDDLYPKRMGTLNPRHGFRVSDYSSSHIYATNLTGIPVDGHEQFRGFCADGRKLHDIVIETAIDVAQFRDLSGKYNRTQPACVGRVGSKNYGYEPAGRDDMYNITIKGLSGNSATAVRVEWSVKNLTINGVTLDYSAASGYDPTTGISTTRPQSVVSCAGGNEMVDSAVTLATAAQTAFVAPAFYREERDLGTLAFTKSANRITIDASAHSIGSTFRATVTFKNGAGDVVAGPDDYNVYVERDEVTGVTTGNLFIDIDDVAQANLAAIPASGEAHVEDKGTERSMLRKQNQYASRYDNGSLKVWVNGVSQTGGTDYTEATGIDPGLPQQITFASGLALDDVVKIHRHEFAAAHQMHVDYHVHKVSARGDKPNQHPIAAQQPLFWGTLFPVARNVSVTGTISDLQANVCTHFLEVADESTVNIEIDNVTLRETGLMPFRFHPESDWEASEITLSGLKTPDRSKIWQYYDADAHGAAPGNLGQVYSGRGKITFKGDNPSVRAASAEHGADIFPQWAGDGSELVFEAGAFPGIPWAVKARKIGDYGTAGDRWAAYALLDGTPLGNLILPSVEGASEQLEITSGQNFRNTATPEKGFALLIEPTYTNTGSINIKVDAMDAATAHVATRDGVSLPGGYLRQGRPTKIVWDGLRWVVHREIETTTGTDGDGEEFTITKRECGAMDIRGAVTMAAACDTAEGSQYVSSTVTKAFPVPFSASARSVVEMGDSIVHRDVRLTNLTSIVVESWCNTSNASTTDVVKYTATGMWF